MQLLDQAKHQHLINVKTRQRMPVRSIRDYNERTRARLTGIAEDLAYLRNPIWWAGMVTSGSTSPTMEDLADI